MYSQHDEEKHLLDIFDGKPPGRLLDIGAHDGHYLSNSLALIERGWGGVLVEANPETFCRLVERHGANPNLELVNAAVGLVWWKLTKFWQATTDTGLSTTEEEQRARRAWQTGFRTPFHVCMIPLVTGLLAHFVGRFDFVSIDTEGTSVDLFLAFPFRLVSPRAICVEHDGQIETCLTYALYHGYSLVTQNSENLLFAL